MGPLTPATALVRPDKRKLSAPSPRPGISDAQRRLARPGEGRRQLAPPAAVMTVARVADEGRARVGCTGPCRARLGRRLHHRAPASAQRARSSGGVMGQPKAIIDVECSSAGWLRRRRLRRDSVCPQLLPTTTSCARLASRTSCAMRSSRSLTAVCSPRRPARAAPAGLHPTLLLNESEFADAPRVAAARSSGLIRVRRAWTRGRRPGMIPRGVPHGKSAVSTDRADHPCGPRGGR